MQRTNLIRARREAGLTQKQLAHLMGDIRQATVSAWETGQENPYPLQIPVLRAILKSNAPDLFDIHTGVGPVKGFKELMEMLRRQFIEALAQIGGTTLFGNVSLALVSSPVVAPEEYLAQCSATIDACWELLNHGSFNRVEKMLNANMPTLARLATTLSPYQGIAANLALQAKIMQILLATRELDFMGRELHCAEAVRFGQLSGNRIALAVALDWQGNTYIYCYRQPQRAISILNDALSVLNSESSLIKSGIYINLSTAYAQDNTQDNYETKARNYAEQARMTIPKHPESDPLYQCIQFGHSELDQMEGKMYLYLAEYFPNSDYAQRAYDAFDKSTSKQAMNQGYLSGSLIKKADAARVMGEMDESVKCLTDGLSVAIEIRSKRRLSEISDVLQGIPENWRKETPVVALQKELTHSLTVVQ